MSNDLPATVTFERDGKTFAAEVKPQPVERWPNALVAVDELGRRYAVLISFGSGGFVARPIVRRAA